MATEPLGDSPEYEELVGILNSRVSRGPLGVEILPDASLLSPWSLVEIIDGSLGIPKAVLVTAFLTAKRIFFEKLDSLDENSKLILDSTSAILLFDPEHITAANARKRICLSFSKRSKSEQLQRLKDELWFTEFLLTSKLKRHNKSPTLWSHRKWLIKNFDMAKELVKVDYEIEDLILLSAENHPRNYYAWDYMRWWIKSRPKGIQTTVTNATLVLFLRDWCLRHISEFSGWSCLMWMLRLPEFWSLEGTALQATVAQRVLDYAVSLNLKNIPLWTFVMEIMEFNYWTSGPKQKVQMEYIKVLDDLRSNEPQGSKMKVFAETGLLHIYAIENADCYD